ncbi:hypothetical protein MLD38_007262 [Melastoma candidum]|uniref:Uncharacterized protein n=1 Tax=Melastoma candidum TaxID=119954 RepID=A0ACB9RTK3_9MYRT|nr:hypothetical protein MLD38_007262 [Melastoma candidum]
MVNFVAIQKPLLHGLMKMAGIRLHSVELEPGTTMSIWVPSETIKKHRDARKPKSTSGNDKPDATVTITNPTKPVVVFVHGFAAEGIVTWQFQAGNFTKKYAVYVPDLIFFGGSTTDKADRSPTFQAECLMKAFNKLGVERFTVVGFSYGGMVAFKMAEMYPEAVEAVVISGSILAMTDSISDETLHRLGFSSSSELLMPSSVKGLKALQTVAMHRKIWFPDRLHKDYLEVMFTNRKERNELLEALVISNKDATIPKYTQRILLLWGEMDQIFKLELAENMKEKLGEKAEVAAIKKAGHLAQLERPCVYNRLLKQFLDSIHYPTTPTKR